MLSPYNVLQRRLNRTNQLGSYSRMGTLSIVDSPLELSLEELSNILAEYRVQTPLIRLIFRHHCAFVPRWRPPMEPER